MTRYVLIGQDPGLPRVGQIPQPTALSSTLRESAHNAFKLHVRPRRHGTGNISERALRHLGRRDDDCLLQEEGFRLQDF